jgi:hypothetical protein
MTNDTPATPHAQPTPSSTPAEGSRSAVLRAAVGQAQTAYTQAAPDIRRLAHHFHGSLHGDLHDDAVAETEAFVWWAFRKLIAQGRDPLPLLGNIVDFAARRVRAGARFAGKVHLRDALSRQREGSFVASLSAGKDEVARQVRFALRDRAPGPAEEAITSLDWEAFLQSLPDENYRDMARGLAEGSTQAEIGARRGVSKAAAQQMGVRLRAKYTAFHGSDKER